MGDLLILKISDGNLVLSLGPDEERTLPELTGKETFSDVRIYFYDPTNGVYSGGDIIGFYE